MQVLLVRLGSEFIDDEFLGKIIDLVVYVFTSYEKVISGGLFILNGLINCVEERIEPLVHKFIKFVVQSMTEPGATDDMGIRLACGLLSDLCSAVSSGMVNY